MLKALMAKRSKLMADRKAILESAEKENRELTAEEIGKVEELVKAQKPIDAQLRMHRDYVQDAAEAMDVATRQAAGRPDSTDDDFSEKEIKKFSVLKVLDSLFEGKPLDGFEAEVAKHCADKAQKSGRALKNGLMVPRRVLLEGSRRFMNTAIGTSTGAGGILTNVRSDYIDALREMTVVGRLGATFVTGLQGTVGFPRSSGITGYWATEGNAPTAGAGTFDQVVLSNKEVGANQDFTRNFIKQTSIDVENFARDQLFKGVAVAVDAGALQGTGANGQPLGILNKTDCCLITAITGTAASSGPVPTNLTGCAMTYALAVAMETIVANQNVMIDQGAYVFPTAIRGTLKQTLRSTYQGGYVWTDDNTINGYPAYATNNVPIVNGTNSASYAGIFGHWPDMLVGMWGDIELMRDPYALSTSGGLRVVALQSVDVQVRHAGSFARIYGLK